MADKGAGGVASGKLPKSESLVPGRGESVGAVRGDNLVLLVEVDRSGT